MSLPSAALIDRYLRLLEVTHREPTLQSLKQIVSAHVTRVPFENVSKLHYRRKLGLATIPELRVFLDGIERYHFGGTCYSCNYHLFLLLSALGFDVKLCGADMRTPNVHMVSIVRLEGREYLVDVGYGAPFLEPLPRDLPEEYVITLGREKYVLAPQDPGGRSRMQVYRDGEPLHGYWAKPAPQSIEDFSAVIANSFRPEATFMNAIMLARFQPGRSVLIHNHSLTVSMAGRAEVTQLESTEAVVAAIERNFGIPARVTRPAIATLPEFRNVWG